MRNSEKYHLTKGELIMLKIGMLGTWHVHTDHYAEEFKKTGKCEIAAVWDHDAVRGREKADSIGCAFYDDLDAFLSSGLDGVCCCAETNLHAEVLIKAARAGVNIFTEKVLTATVEDAEKVAREVKENGVKFCISFPWRSRGDFRWIKAKVDEGLFGDVSYVRMHNAHNGVSAGWLPASFLDPVPTCGGAMMDLGAHGMYTLNWLLGEPVSVSSTFTNFMCKTVEDNCVSSIAYKSGAIGVSETSFVASCDPFKLELTGTRGSVLCGWSDGRLCYNVGDGWVYPNIPRDAKTPIEMFVDDILGGEKAEYGIEDAVLLTKTMAAAYAVK